MKRILLTFLLLIPSACFTTVTYHPDWRIEDAVEAIKEQGGKVDIKCFQPKCLFAGDGYYIYLVCIKYHIALPDLDNKGERKKCSKKEAQ